MDAMDHAQEAVDAGARRAASIVGLYMDKGIIEAYREATPDEQIQSLIPSEVRTDRPGCGPADPPKPLRIALIGSAPSSIKLAPYDDPAWTIWGCSPGASSVAKRSDAWFELHRWDTKRGDMPPGYVEFLREHPCVYVSVTGTGLPGEKVLDWRAHTAEFGPYFFTSSVAWMFAEALKQGATEIAFFGVDMAADSEYGQQRPALQHFAQLAQQRGVIVTAPPESDLFWPAPLYGVGEADPMWIKLHTRMEELKARRQGMYDQEVALNGQRRHIEGALDDLHYVMNTYLGMRGPPVGAKP